MPIYLFLLPLFRLIALHIPLKKYDGFDEGYNTF